MMKNYLYNQNGSTIALALLTMMFLAIIISGIAPLVNSQVLHSSLNNDMIEAQYVAEGGAKRAIVGLQNNRTDWSWANGTTHNLFINGTDKYYITSITPSITNAATPSPNTTYTITSDGWVGKAHKRVVVTVKTSSSGSGPFNYALFTKGDMLIQNPLITGDIYSNQNIKTTSGAKMVIGKAYSKTQAIENSSNITGGYTAITEMLPLDINSLIPTMPPVSMTGTQLARGLWNNNTYTLSNGSYYYNGDYALNGHSYYVPAGTSVVIYINGTLSLYSGYNISGGGNITICATGDINLSGGSILGLSTSTIQVYANKTFNLNSNSYINGGNVTVLANNAANAKQAIGFNGGSINKDLASGISKICAKGTVALNNVSVISGSGTGMLVTTGNVELNGGTAASSVIISGGNVQGNSGSTVAGIYANGLIKMVGTSVTYNDTAMQTLGLGGTPTPFSILSWSN